MNRTDAPTLSVQYGQEVALKRAKCSIMSCRLSFPPAFSFSRRVRSPLRITPPPRQRIIPIFRLLLNLYHRLGLDKCDRSKYFEITYYLFFR